VVAELLCEVIVDNVESELLGNVKPDKGLLRPGAATARRKSWQTARIMNAAYVAIELTLSR